MEWEVILALVLGIPLMLSTQIYLWYLIIGGTCEAINEAWEKRAAREVRGAKTQPLGTRH